MHRLATLLVASALALTAPPFGPAVSQTAPTAPHLGSPEQAVVAIEVISSSADGAGQAVRRGSGFVVRCDGFVLAPAALFSRSVSVAGQTEEAGKQSISVFVNPGTADEKKYAGRRPRHTPRDIPYVAIKMDGFHGPALRTLLPDRVKADSVLTVVYAGWDPTGRRTGTGRKITRLSGLNEKDDAPPGQARLTEELDGVPAGSVVIGPDGMAVGITSGSGSVVKTATFSSFSALHRVTNCVSAASAPESELEGLPKTGPMVRVTEGPIRLGGAITGDQPDLEGARTACLPQFEIDQFEVTNEQYLEFWNALPAERKRFLGFRNQHYPATWSQREPPFPPGLAKMPVIGVALPGAMAYAKWAGKRLPTPYEWAAAAFGSDGDLFGLEWMRLYVGERLGAWRKIKQYHEQYLRQRPEMQTDAALIGSLFLIPWIPRSAGLLDAGTFSKDIVTRHLDPLMSLFRDPLYLEPAGAREFDASPCGARDMILNAAELILPFPGVPVRGEPRAMEVLWPPGLPEANDPWRVRPIEAITSGRPLPPLSRLYKRALTGPTPEDIVFWSNLNETVQMLGPVGGWRLTMSNATEVQALLWPSGSNPYTGLNRPAGFKLWEHIPARYRQEMGRPVPLDSPDAHTPPGAQLFYYLPVGFRCAR